MTEPLHNTFGIAMRNFTAYPEMPDAQALVDYGVRMEEMGFDSLWVWDHILLGVEPNFPDHRLAHAAHRDRRAHEEDQARRPASWCCRCAIPWCSRSSSRASISSRTAGC